MGIFDILKNSVSTNSKAPDEDGNDHRPKLAAATFVFIFLAIGLPVWWQTTTVHRASLPYEEIENLSISPPQQKIKIYFKSSESTVVNFKPLFHELSKSDLYDIEVTHVKPTVEEMNIINQDSTIDNLDRLLPSLKGKRDPGEGLIFIEVPAGKLPSGKNLVLGRHRYIYFSTETPKSLISNVFSNLLYSSILEEGSSKGNRFTPSINYSILITLATSNPDIDWNIRNVADDYLMPFVNKFAYLANLTVSTQVIYLGSGQIDTNFNRRINAHVLNEDKVASLINALEPKLGSQLSVEPTFHWVIYVPHAKQVPMQIHVGSQAVGSNSVLSPRWNGGGLQILNGDIFDAQAISGLIVSQLRNALGFQNAMLNADVDILSYDSSGIHQWELEHLIRQRTIHFLHNAGTTLKSLCQLLSQIENIVISDTVGDDIVTSLVRSIDSRQLLSSGDAYEAYKAAQMAITCSERAFFHQSLLALLYFPNDQKYAIYIPLFLPVCIPVLLSMIGLPKYLMQRRSKSS